MTNVPNAVEK